MGERKSKFLVGGAVNKTMHVASGDEWKSERVEHECVL